MFESKACNLINYIGLFFFIEKRLILRILWEKNMSQKFDLGEWGMLSLLLESLLNCSRTNLA